MAELKPSRLRESIITIGLPGILTVFLTLLACYRQSLAFESLTLGIVVVLGARRPEILLGAVLVLTSAGGSQAVWSSAGGVVAVVGGTISFIAIIKRNIGVNPRIFIVGLLLGWLVIRFSIEHDFETSMSYVKCAAAAAIAVDCVQRNRKIRTTVAAAGLIFMIISIALGSYNAGGLRFDGVSGNANRMVFALLIFLPFIISLAATRHAAITRLIGAAGTVTTVVLVIASGSDQGIAGLAVIAGCCLICFVWRFPAWVRYLAVLWVALAFALTLPAAMRSISNSTDLSTLSGRTPIYQAAIADFTSNPWIGSGSVHVSNNGIVDRSAHSAMLSIAASGGIIGAILWIAVLVLLCVVALRLFTARSVLAAVPVVLIAEQLVQAVDLSPMTWIVVGLFLSWKPNDFQNQKITAGNRLLERDVRG